MSLKLNERYPGRFNNPSESYPQGSFKNRTAPGAKDGSYLEEDWANDKEGFFQSLLSSAGVEASGEIDRVGSSQYFDALKTISLTPDATESVKGKAKIATQALTNSGVDDTTMVTPKKLNGAINALVIQATEATAGIMKLATQAQVNAGADDTVAVTPKKLLTGFVFSTGENGYIKFPSFLGGWLIQWGRMQWSNNTGVAVNYSIQFPTAVYGVWHQRVTTGSGAFTLTLESEPTLSSCTFRHPSAAITERDFWYAIGR